MQTTHEKQNTASGGPTGEEKTTGSNKAWWEQLAGAMPEDKESVKNWYKLLSNSLIVIIGLLVLGYWLLTQKPKTSTNTETEQLKKEIELLKKKRKKLKKRIRTPMGNIRTHQRSAVLD